MLHRCSLLALFTFLLALGNIANAGPNLLTDNWISCSDNSRTVNIAGLVELNSECLFQEIEFQSGDRLDLVCDVRTNGFASTQLSYADENFNVLNTFSDNTNTDTTFLLNGDRAPQNTVYAVATIFANQQASMDCALSEPDDVTMSSSDPVTQTLPSAGGCIDSDGDGFGWNGVATCIPDSSPSSNTSGSFAGACLDPDGDGFGWNGVSTCIPDSSTSSDNSATTGSTAGACVDSDGDGFGWNGVATCIVGVTEPNTASNPSPNPQANPAPASVPDITSPDISNLTDLILVTGQSNAQGSDTQVSLSVLDAPNNRVFAFTDEDGWQVADLRQHWDGPNEPRHPGNNALIFSSNTPHNNFAFHFAKSLVALDPNRVVGFVLATAPGAGIRQWDRGSSFYNTVSNKAMTALNASSKTSFDGVLWHQGETDFLFSGTSDLAAPASERLIAGYYPARLSTLIRNLRQEAWFSGDRAVFICGETQKTNPDVTEIAPVNRRLMAINNDTDRFTGCVTADGLPTKDGIHFNASALRELGKRYAEKYLQLKDQ